jgi:hypothetical protein
MAVQFNGSSQGYYCGTLPHVKPNFTACMFVRPEQTNGDRFKAIFNICQPPFRDYHFIVWMDDDGSGPSFMASYDDEAPDFARIPFKQNQWYFIGYSELIVSPNAASRAIFFMKPVGGPSFKTSYDIPTTGTFDTLTGITLGVDVFSEWGKSSLCGVRLWNKFKSLGEMEVESMSIRATDRRGLIGEYPLNFPEFTDYSGQKNHLSLDASGVGMGTLVSPTRTNGPNVPQFYLPSSRILDLVNGGGGGLQDVSVDETSISVSDTLVDGAEYNRPNNRITSWFLD